jgi:hypothetical protein
MEPAQAVNRTLSVLQDSERGVARCNSLFQ